MKKERLISLDILRGADIFVLTVVSVIIAVVNKYHPLPGWLLTQFDHPEWIGFSFYDIIMPLFIFMSGASVPLANPKWAHVLRRFALLWVFGMVAQGELLTFDLHRISFFNNTLQTIAWGYLITVIVMKAKARWVPAVSAVALALIYTLFLHLGGDMSPAGNAAVVYETKFLLWFYPDASWYPVSQIATYHYTWWPTIPMFGTMAICGALATMVLRSELKGWTKVTRLALIGVGLLILGAILNTFDPCVKHIFTVSFTSYVMGVCFLLYGLCYALFDVLKIAKGTKLMTLFGRNSLLAYMLHEIANLVR